MWVATSVPRTLPIYFKWMGLSSEEGNFADINITDSVVSLMVEILLFLVLLEALFGRQFSWWKVTFFLSSFLLVLIG